MDNNFSFGGKEFKLSKLDAFKQFHIVRRIAPLLAELVPAMAEISKVAKAGETALSESEKLDQFAKIAQPLMVGLSKLSDTDASFVLMGLLAAAEIKQEGGNWARIARDGQLMFHDLELPLMLAVAGRVFAYNLGGFFSALPKVS